MRQKILSPLPQLSASRPDQKMFCTVDTVLALPLDEKLLHYYGVVIDSFVLHGGVIFQVNYSAIPVTHLIELVLVFSFCNPNAFLK